MTARPPLALRSDELEVVILPDAGGRIHRIRAFGEDLLRTPDDPSTHGVEPFFWGAYVMAPWCNRARPGRMEVAGRRVELEPNFPDGTAIHGLVSSAPWDRDGDHELAIRRDAGRGWPWAFEARQAATLDGPLLAVRYRLTNLERDAPMPAGLGLHPWFRREVELAVPASRAYASNTGSSPAPEPVAGDIDLRSLRRPATGIDATMTGLADPRIDHAWPDPGIRVRPTRPTRSSRWRRHRTSMRSPSNPRPTARILSAAWRPVSPMRQCSCRRARRCDWPSASRSSAEGPDPAPPQRMVGTATPTMSPPAVIQATP
jgi:galactose mutarotase-like enzyme